MASPEFWTYTRPINRPDWVKACTEIYGTALILVRRSGSQEIRPGETISVGQDGEILHHVNTAPIRTAT